MDRLGFPWPSDGTGVKQSCIRQNFPCVGGRIRVRLAVWTNCYFQTSNPIMGARPTRTYLPSVEESHLKSRVNGEVFTCG